MNLRIVKHSFVDNLLHFSLSLFPFAHKGDALCRWNEWRHEQYADHSMAVHFDRIKVPTRCEDCPKASACVCRVL